ncbi:hypothetical protein AGMMS49579_13610 [Spirochaetia bacterium]|nr:hypothetical protein AGMMS49579_13610 [Spirochaetia bacterium]
MKKILCFIICAFSLVIGCFAETTDSFEFKTMAYWQYRFHDDFSVSYKYNFTDGVLTSIVVDNQELEHKKTEVFIKRTQGKVQVYDADGKEIVALTLVDVKNFVIDADGYPNRFLVTIDNDILYFGIYTALSERFFMIKKDAPLVFNFRRNGVAINKSPFVDYRITNDDDSKIQDMANYTHYRKISDTVFDHVSNDPMDPIPGYRCVILKRANNYRFSLVDMFIDYFCGSTMDYPIIWGQLVSFSMTTDMFKDFGF